MGEPRPCVRAGPDKPGGGSSGPTSPPPWQSEDSSVHRHSRHAQPCARFSRRADALLEPLRAEPFPRARDRAHEGAERRGRRAGRAAAPDRDRRLGAPRRPGGRCASRAARECRRLSLERLRRSKPVLVSMSGVAASGGYYMQRYYPPEVAMLGNSVTVFGPLLLEAGVDPSVVDGIQRANPLRRHRRRCELVAET